MTRARSAFRRRFRAADADRAGRVVQRPLLHVRSRRAVDAISFAVQPGDVFGLLGPNGAGKTTTIRILTTLLKPGGGSARIFGLDVAHRSMQVHRLLGYVPQQLSIDAQLTGYENVWLFTRLFDVPRSERKGRAREALTLMGLVDVSDRMASTYSGGMIRRLELAQAFVNGPRLLILDEPMIGIRSPASASGRACSTSSGSSGRPCC